MKWYWILLILAVVVGLVFGALALTGFFGGSGKKDGPPIPQGHGAVALADSLASTPAVGDTTATKIAKAKADSKVEPPNNKTTLPPAKSVWAKIWEVVWPILKWLLIIVAAVGLIALIGWGVKSGLFDKGGKAHWLLYPLAAICFLVAAYFVPSSPVNTSMILAIMGCFSCSMARNYKDAQKFTSDAAKLGRYWKARLSLPILKIYAFLAIIWLALIIGTYLKQKGAPL
ncbi:MAG TPA: hypothetical protein PLR18_03430 [bacterium]|nr:hypothetical protein [bacterium]